jgi:hypothetical protein
MVAKVSTVFILGAGFSKGYNPKDVPLIEQFLKCAKKKKVLKPEGEHKELVDFVGKYFGEYSSVNIETLASFLTTELIPDIDQRNIYRDKLYRQLISIVTGTLSEIQDHPVDKDVQDTYKKFVDKIVKNGTNIITFNYDLILDKLLLDTDNWWHTTGYGVKIPIDIEPETLFPVDNSEMQYLKLHGSLNWSRRIVPHPKYGDRIVLSPFGFNVNHERIPRIHTGSPSESFYDPFIVPPIMAKESFYKDPLLQNIWYEAKDLLCKAHEIVIIGYSFPPADFPAEFLFRQSIASPSSGKEKKIRVINREIDDSYKSRVENIFQKSSFEYREEDVVEFLKNYTEE